MLALLLSSRHVHSPRVGFPSIWLSQSEDAGRFATLLPATLTDAPQRRAQLTASRLVIEERISALFSELKAMPQGTSSATQVEQLNSAKAELEAVRFDEQRRECEEAITSAESPADAAERIDALACSGVAPDELCYMQALAACVRASDRAESVEWAVLLYEEAVATCGVGGGSTSLALRACVLGGASSAAAGVLSLGATVDALPPATELEWAALLLPTDSTKPYGEAMAAIGVQLAAESERYWRAEKCELSLPSGLPAAVTVEVLAAAVDDVKGRQLQVGKSFSAGLPPRLTFPRLLRPVRCALS